MQKKYTTLGNIPLQDIHSVVAADEAETQRKHCFQILTSTRLFYLACNSEQEMEEWIDTIKQGVSLKNGTAKPAENVTVRHGCNLTDTSKLHIPLEFIKEMKRFQAPLYPRAVSITTDKNEVRYSCLCSNSSVHIF
jgi:hypothetical protein